MDHGFCIVKQRGSYIDVLEFMSPSDNHDMNNVYLRYIDYINKFVDYFYRESESIIKKCEQKRLIFPVEEDIFLKEDESSLIKKSNFHFPDALYALQMKSRDSIIVKSADRTAVWGHFERISEPGSSFGFSIPFSHEKNVRDRFFIFNNQKITLTVKQSRCFELLKRGYSNKQIANYFGNSPRTIESLVATILKKFNLTSRRELIDTQCVF
jgi:DNA-binding CsgD family transcriptional regulator